MFTTTTTTTTTTTLPLVVAVLIIELTSSFRTFTSGFNLGTNAISIVPKLQAEANLNAVEFQSRLKTNQTLGFIGLGIMGDGMARRLLGSGSTLRVWNRSIKKCVDLKEEFKEMVTICDSPSSVIAGSDVTFLMLSTPEACKNVYFQESGVLQGISAGKCVVDCATLEPDDMLNISNEVILRGGRFLEAPVSGSKVPAETGQLIFLTAGDEELYKECQQYFTAMGKANYYTGIVGEGTKLKLVVNGIMANMLAALAEGMILAEKSGLDPEVLLSVLSQGAMNNPMFNIKGPKMLSGEHPPNFPLKHAYKDLLFSIAMAKNLKQEVKLSEAAEVLYGRAMKDGYGDEDFAAVYNAFK